MTGAGVQLDPLEVLMEVLVLSQWVGSPSTLSQTSCTLEEPNLDETDELIQEVMSYHRH